MENIIPILIIVLVLGGAVFYIVRSKKGGKKCIGCPYADSCAKKCCSSDENSENEQ